MWKLEIFSLMTQIIKKMFTHLWRNSWTTKLKFNEIEFFYGGNFEACFSEYLTAIKSINKDEINKYVMLTSKSSKFLSYKLNGNLGRNERPLERMIRHTITLEHYKVEIDSSLLKKGYLLLKTLILTLTICLI